MFRRVSLDQEGHLVKDDIGMYVCVFRLGGLSF